MHEHLWVGWLAGFGACTVVCLELHKSRPAKDVHAILLYTVPAICMLGLHAMVANHTTRYNLILIGPFRAGAAM